MIQDLSDVEKQKVEEISLIENVQRNSMTTADKIRAYSRLYTFYKEDIKKVSDTVHISSGSLKKYLTRSHLPQHVITKLDSKGNNKLSIDVALQLAKIPNNLNMADILSEMTEMSNPQKTIALKKINNLSLNKDNIDITDCNQIIDDTITESHNLIKVANAPYVYDNDNNVVLIPQELYQDVINLINKKIKSSINTECHVCDGSSYFQGMPCRFCHESNPVGLTNPDDEFKDNSVDKLIKFENNNNNLCFLDIETDGNDTIIQIAYSIYSPDFQFKLKKNLIINNNGVIDYFKKYTKQYIIKNGITPKEAIDILKIDLHKCKFIICHNVEFDVPKIKKYVKLNNLDMINFPKTFCTMKSLTNTLKLKGRYGKFKYPKLKELYKYCFDKYPNKELEHTAHGDVKIMYDSFQYLFENKIIRINNDEIYVQ